MTDILARFKEGAITSPVDRLATLRALEKQIKEIGEYLKAEISEKMGDADSLGGDAFIARQRLSERKGGLDEKRLKAEFGDEAVERCRKPSTTSITLVIEPRVVEA